MMTRNEAQAAFLDAIWLEVEMLKADPPKGHGVGSDPLEALAARICHLLDGPTFGETPNFRVIPDVLEALPDGVDEDEAELWGWPAENLSGELHEQFWRRRGMVKLGQPTTS